jgi:hypothetical protein
MTTSDTCLTAVIAAEEVLGRLQNKKGDIVARFTTLDKERQALGFAVHSEGDKASRKQLDALNHEAVGLDGELVSLEAAIAEGARRLEEAQRELAQREDFENARQVKKTFAHLLKLAQSADEHLNAFGQISAQMKSEVDQLHSMGQAMPTHAQMMTFGALATSTVMMALPWARQMEARHLAPSERRNFTTLFKGWHDAAIRNIEARIGSLTNGGGSEQQKDHAHAD